MGATSWHDGILQALLIGLVVQIVAYALWIFWAVLWAAWKERMARPATGESVAESDVEMGTVNVAEGATIPGNPPHVLTANSGVGDDGKLEDTENTINTRASTPETSTVHGSSTKVVSATEDEKRRATVPVVVDVSHPYRVEARGRKEV